MNAIINKHQLHEIIAHILKEYDSFGTVDIDDRESFVQLEKPSDFQAKIKKTIIPFKKILWPNDNSLPYDKTKIRKESKIAFLGITNCDAHALEIFYKQFERSDLLPKDVFVMTSECIPDKNCFCSAFGSDKIKFSDLHIQTEGKNYSIHSLTKKGEKLLEVHAIKQDKHRILIREIKQNAPRLNKNDLAKKIEDKSGFADFWQKISDNCFGCGACTAVCPLCFCFRQKVKNDKGGDCQQCLEWDSCFSKSFAEIHHSYNYRPANIDRLYNWYHHKFVRAPYQNGEILCTGCGRCIDACPANLNQHQIIKAILDKNDSKE